MIASLFFGVGGMKINGEKGMRCCRFLGYEAVGVRFLRNIVRKSCLE